MSYCLLVALARTTRSGHRRSADDVRLPPVITANKIIPKTPKDILPNFGRKEKSDHNRLGDYCDVVAQQHDDMNYPRFSEIREQVLAQRLFRAEKKSAQERRVRFGYGLAEIVDEFIFKIIELFVLIKLPVALREQFNFSGTLFHRKCRLSPNRKHSQKFLLFHFENFSAFGSLPSIFKRSP